MKNELAQKLMAGLVGYWMDEGLPLSADAITKSPAEQIGEFFRTGSNLKMVPDVTEMAIAGVVACANSNCLENIGNINRGLAACESPIEQAIFVSLWTFIQCASGYSNDYIVVRLNDGLTYGKSTADDVFIIEPQAKVGDFRVDFRITRRESVPDFDNKDETGMPGVTTAETRVIVECDGHDFHERTKEQAAKDRSRDRTLQSVGYTIFRFTGSEIWNDPVKCCREIIDCLNRIP